MKPPYRILFPFVGDTVGGSHLSALALIGGLDRRLFEPIVLVHQDGRLADYLAARGTPYIRSPNVTVARGGPIYRRTLDLFRCALPLSSYMRAERIAAVHTNDMRMHLTWGLAARCAGARFIWHQRTMAPLGPTGLFTCLANEVIAISESCRQSLIGHARHQAKVIPNPVYSGGPLLDRSAARAALLNCLPANAGARLIAFIGNLTAQKRPLVFVEAAARLREYFEGRIKFLMFGEERPPIADAVRSRIATLGLERDCILMGPRFPIEPWLAGCDLLLAPAVNEGFGRTLIEAMLVGTPVVASASGGHVEIVEHGLTGLLAPVDDPCSLAAAATEILKDPSRARALAEAARPSAMRRYSVTAHVAAVERDYRDLLR
jgi:glycosyltransferase involved in cell wall biosynthesis